ncbi:MAG TPA: L-threonylcarbamoyladenylate synthase [Usitatibacter sp.]|nr:L-threonylcarbamoyladenylate synthase [Usitatibacter sp.]
MDACIDPDEAGLARAARLLAAGEVVAFPTETVYGLGADAARPEAVSRIYALKGRPSNHPVIVHLAPGVRIADWAVDIPAEAGLLGERFWPGPLTLVLRKAARVPDSVTGGQATVAIRYPAHPVARALLEAFARIGSGGVAAPSANRFGHVSPTTAQHVREEFGPSLPLIDGGSCDVGLESTIVDLSRGEPVLLRPGGISRAQLEAALARPLRDRDAGAPRVSGTLEAHYAPRTALSLVAGDALDAAAVRPDVAILALRGKPPGAHATAWIAAPAEPTRYGHDLYANLRSLDASGANRILVEAPPAEPAWEAVNDRLRRAAAGSLDDEP